MEWSQYIVADHKVLLGKPVIKGTRISVELILELFESGWNVSMILESYPNITAEHVQAVFSYVKDCMQHEFFFQLPKSA